MTAVREAFALLIARLPAVAVRLLSPGDIGGFLTILLFVIVLDRARRQNLGRYRETGFRVDLTYAVFYLCGVYTLFVGLPLFRVLTRTFDAIAGGRILPLARLPVFAQVVAGIVVVDLFSYAWHRSVHANRFLWPFHSVHHSQKYLTVATGFRTHFADEVVRTTFMFVPLYFLGIRPHSFLAVDLLVNWILGLQHSDLGWSYGVLGKVIVSPHYHRIHHSLDADDRDRNFSVLFAFWDRLFSTRAAARERPLRYGIDEAGCPESFVRQLAWPFIVLARSVRTPAAVATPGEVR